MDIVAFRLFGDYAHFSHPETIYSSLTYPVPSKTTIMGLLGAIIGEDEFWKLSEIKYSVKIEREIKKKSFVFNGIRYALASSMKLAKGYQDCSKKKQFYRELICKPSYIIYINLTNLSQEYREKIINNLKEHKSAYTPYLGINFCIADFEWIDINDLEKINDSDALVDTIVPMDNYIFEGLNIKQKLSTFRAACNVEEGRYYKDFKDFVVDVKGQYPLKAKNNNNIYRINDEQVFFI